jgi:hypothetical protein
MVHASIAVVTISPNKTAAGRRSPLRSPRDRVRRLLLDTSAKAAQARRLLVSIGWLQYVQSLVPVLGVVERAGVSLLHIGFTLLLSWNPWLMLVTMPAYSATNLVAVRLMKQRSVILMETIVVVVGAVAFALGLLAWQR